MSEEQAMSELPTVELAIRHTPRTREDGSRRNLATNSEFTIELNGQPVVGVRSVKVDLEVGKVPMVHLSIMPRSVKMDPAVLALINSPSIFDERELLAYTTPLPEDHE